VTATDDHNPRKRGVGPSGRPVRTSLSEVAHLAGVAQSSASRALSDAPGVSDETRRRVHAAARELGYQPNLLAKSLRQGATQSIGFVVRDISNPLLAEIALGAEIVLREAGYGMLLTNSEGEPSLDAEHIRMLAQRRVDGLLLSLASEDFRATATELQQLAVPFVTIDRHVSFRGPYGSVVCDDASAIRRVVEHLVELGHRRIALASGPADLLPGRECATALRAACAAGDAEAMVFDTRYSEAEGYLGTRALLAGPDRPTALIVGSNLILPGALRAVREAGLRVPDDLSLVTFDHQPLLDFIEPAIAVVSRQPLVVGREAAALILRMMAGDSPVEVRVPTLFDPRGTCVPPPRTV
jgi:LacI family transcriptional regulator